MSDASYRIDELGPMERLDTLGCFCSREAARIGSLEFTVSIETTDRPRAVSLHPYVHSVLAQLSARAAEGKAALARLYEEEATTIAGLTVNHVAFHTDTRFTLHYNLPAGSAVEYLSVSFDGSGELLETSLGNY